MKFYKVYRYDSNLTLSHKKALALHRDGLELIVETHGGDAMNDYIIRAVTVHGATQAHDDRDENRDYCKRVADELESYVAGDVRRCPNCGQEHDRAWDDVGDKFRCPSCGSVDDVDDWEQLGIYDYMDDVLDYDFRIDSQREFSGIRVYVTLGGPSCWIDTERRTVEIRWGGKSACYDLLSDTVDAVEEWGREIWEMGC